MILVSILFSIVGLLAGVLLGLILRMVWIEGGMRKARESAHRLLDLARRESEEIRKETLARAKDESVASLEMGERELRNRRAEVLRMERRVEVQLQTLDKRLGTLADKEQALVTREKDLEQKKRGLEQAEADLEQRREALRLKLEEIAGLSAEQAKQELVEKIAEEARRQAAEKVQAIEEETMAQAEHRAQRIVSHAIQRISGDFAAERTVSLLTLPSDELKGRIIGREGRNIRALEMATSTDIIIDDTPQLVVISSHNPVRREIAKRTLEKLIAEGKIHPARVEEVVKIAEKEMEAERVEVGKKVLAEVGVVGMDPRLVDLLGSLKFRYTESQDILQHSLEVATFAGAMAAELGLDEKLARRAGLLHDIGKAVEERENASHAVVGADIAAQYGEPAEVVEAIRGHHETDPESVLALLVQAADQLSNKRPGARDDRFHHAVQRLDQVEKLISSVKGVQRCYAVETGKETRVVVFPEEMANGEATLLVNEITRKIREEKLAPGELRVNVVREAPPVGFVKEVAS
ncbi:MAG: ribonuclease Y [Deltaproteobacteria bacterium]|nr:ribonuclease Y [Deltaproteobacteria bacterium]